MALDATTADEYIRSAQQQQQLFAFWWAAGDVARAELAMNVGNWYYQQLGLPFYQPAEDPGYTVSPIDPATGTLIAASLPVNPGSNAIGAGVGTVTGAGGTSGAGYQDLTRTAGSIGTTAGGSGNSAALATPSVHALDYGGFTDPTADYCYYYPDDPICWDNYGGTDPGGGGGGPITVVPPPVTVVINENGLTLGTVASLIKGALGAAAAAIASAADAVVAAAISGIQKALTALGNALQQVFGELARLAGLILKFLQGLLLDIVHGLVAAVAKIGALLQDVIHNVIMPALQALQKLRNYLIGLYERFFRPLLIFLQRIRQVLAILKAFHIGFASKLDAAIADIQAKISAPLFYLLRYTNAIANYLNLILTFNYLLQKPLFLNSLNAYKGSAIGLQLNAMNPVPDPAALAALQASGATPTPTQSAAATVNLLANGSGDYAPIVTGEASQLDTYLLQGFD
jgi:hypothetical protein